MKFMNRSFRTRAEAKDLKNIRGSSSVLVVITEPVAIKLTSVCLHGLKALLSVPTPDGAVTRACEVHSKAEQGFRKGRFHRG